MKFSTVIVSALAAVVSAAPAQEKRQGGFNADALNGLSGFNSLDVNYLSVINSFDLQLLEQLAQQNNFNANGFQNLFQGNVFDVNAILQLQQLQILLQLGQLGVFNSFDLSGLNLQLLQLGLIQNVGSFDLSSLIDASLVPQITAISQQRGKSTSSPWYHGHSY